jgi:hypothetical protein
VRASPRLAGALALLSWLTLLGCASAHGTDAPRARARIVPVAATGASAAGFRFFSASSPWNRPLPARPRLAGNSRRVLGALEQEIAQQSAQGLTPTIDTSAYSVPIYTVGADQPPVSVVLQSDSPAPGLRAAFAAVPLPPQAQPAAGSDGHLLLWQPSRERLWEFWRLSKGAQGWSAAWGGAMRAVSGASGVYGPRAWPGATRWWGASASSLSIAGGLITFADLQSGTIDHALAIALPEVRAGVFASPAQRTDGTSPSTLALPEGARLRLNPRLDVAALHLAPLTRMIALAAQRYGIIVRDRSARVAFFGEDPAPLGSDPYTAAGGYFDGLSASQLLASFPWRELQLLRMTLHHGGAPEGRG